MIKCIRVDEHKIVSKGIKSVRDRVTNISDHLPKTINELEFKEQMVASSMDGSDKKYQLRPSDSERINAISKEKFENWEWNYGRSPKFNITKTGRFDGGKMEFKLDVNKGIIRSCHIYGDFFGSIDISKLSNALINRQYKKETIKKALAKLELTDAFYHISVDDLIDIIC